MVIPGRLWLCVTCRTATVSRSGRGTRDFGWQPGISGNPDRQRDGHGRRSFLIGAGAVLVGAAAAGKSAAAKPPQAAASGPATPSYQETDHVRRYYARARF